MKKNLIWAVLIIAGIGAGIAVAVGIKFIESGNSGSSGRKDPGQTLQQGQEKIVGAEDTRHVAAEGRIESVPGFEVEVGSELEGKIAEFSVEEGAYVRKGSPIARIEDREIRAKLKEAVAEAAAARAKYREVETGSRAEEIRKAEAVCSRAAADAVTARKEGDRYRRLFEQGMVSRSSYDEMERAADVAAARKKEADEDLALLKQGPKKDTVTFYLDSARRAESSAEYYKAILDKTVIRAPISGKVIRKYLQQGEMVSREVTPTLVAIADTEKIRVNAEVDETDVARFSLGDPVEITTYAYPGRTFKGTVQEIADYAGLRKVTPNNPVKNRDMKIVQVKVALPEKSPFKLGMTVDVRILPKKIAAPETGHPKPDKNQ